MPVTEDTTTEAPNAGSNALPVLAARIKAEHNAVSTALTDSLRHAIACGEALIEAKALVAHGGWLPWLSEHCQLSERSCQLYMRVAKNRAEIENEIRNDVADLTLSEAAGLLVLSSDVRKLFRFVRDADNLHDPEEIIKVAMDANVGLLGVFVTPGYHPLAGRDEEERREWHAFMLFLVKRCGWHPDGASAHVEWVLQRPFQNVAEWLGPEGDNFRKVNMKAIPDATKQAWQEFLQEENRSQPEIEAELVATATRYGPPVPARMGKLGKRARHRALPAPPHVGPPKSPQVGQTYQPDASNSNAPLK
jgi:hypothetical protein